jgi:FKBP-type peptidyl-prolyl cis-trans isomerase
LIPAILVLAVAACASQPEPKAPVAKISAEDAAPACQATPRELIVKDLEPGEGRPLVPRASVMVHYTGWLYDGCKADLKGTMFDTSVGRPGPFGLMVGAGKVIKGWDEGLVGMKEKRAKRLIIIPPDKAYGEKGVQDPNKPGEFRIPPNAALVFEVNTVGIGYYPPTEPGK